jgi:hypothetical protein
LRPLYRILSFCLVLTPVFASAHHGTRFILAVEYDMVRQPFFFITGSYLKFNGSRDLEVEPAVVFPVGSDGMTEFELHAHLEQPDSEPLRHQATGFEIRRRLTRSTGWNFATSLEYETVTHNADGPNNWTATLIAGREDRNGIVLLNLLDEQDAVKGAKPFCSYRAAWSPTPKGLVDYSLEFQGDMVSHGSHEVVIGAMQHMSPVTMLKIGVGTGLTNDSPRYSLRIGLVRALSDVKD